MLHASSILLGAASVATNQSHSNQAKSHSIKQAFDWIKIIDEWKASGMSQSDYCNANQINYHQFVYQHGKITGRTKTNSKLLPIKVSHTDYVTPEQNHFMLHYPDGLKLYIPVNTHPTVIKAFLTCLER